MMHPEKLRTSEQYARIPRQRGERAKDGAEDERGEGEDREAGVPAGASVSEASGHSHKRGEQALHKPRTHLSLSGPLRFLPSSSKPPSSRARFHAPRALSSTAMSRGVRPSLSFVLKTAPFSMSLRMAVRFPRTTAQCSGASPASSWTVGEAPCHSSSPR